MEIEYIEGHEVEHLVGQFAGAMDALARQARGAGEEAIALAASDAGDALYVLLDTWVREMGDFIPYRKL